MVLRISKTGAIYYDAPFSQEELQEERHSASCAVPGAEAIALKRLEAGRHAFIAAGDVAVGWCTKREGGWYIENSTDGRRLAGPFRTLAAATSAGQRLLAHEPGPSNPRW